MTNRKTHLRVAWSVNGMLILMMLLASMLTDGNGRLPGLSEMQSLVVVSMIIAVGLAVDAYIGIIDRKRRPLAIGVILVYVAMLIPVFL